jgi:hypothetical protein
MEDFDHKQMKDKVEEMRNGKNSSGTMLLMQCCQMFAKFFGDDPLVTLSGGGKFRCYIWPLYSESLTRYDLVADKHQF